MDPKRTEEQKFFMRELGADDAIPLSNKKLSGPIDWLGLAAALHKRFVSRGGRPSDPQWDTKRLVPFRRKIWEYLAASAKQISATGPKVRPAQLAGIMIERYMAPVSSSNIEVMPIQSFVNTGTGSSAYAHLAIQMNFLVEIRTQELMERSEVMQPEPQAIGTGEYLITNSSR
jgi:hypothetical protein